MAKVPVSKLYNHYYVDRKVERLDMFRKVAKNYGGTSALYPGSFVHITPSIVYPTTVYVDNDSQAKQFFANPANFEPITKRKHYLEDSTIRFHAADFQMGIDEPDASFDLLISFFSGFVSLHCKRYLKKGGLLIVNDSHGDASMASLDSDFQLVAVINQTDGRFTISETYLDTYFVTKADTLFTQEWLHKHLRGFKFRRVADSYLFRRNG